RGRAPRGARRSRRRGGAGVSAGDAIRPARAGALKALLLERIVVLDGAMGTMLQKKGLSEEEARGERFRGHGQDLKGDLDVLCLTQPGVVEEVHRAYLSAGADIIETNSFNAN